MLLLAGCIGMGGSQAPKPSQGRATYEWEGNGTAQQKDSPETVSIEVGPPTAVRDATGRLRRAYIANVSWSEQSGSSRRSLDGSFQVVRHDSPCTGRDCVYLSWRGRDEPMPLGIGFLAQYERTGALTFPDAEGHPQRVLPKVSRSHGTTTLELTEDLLPPNDKYIAGTYRFTESSVFPRSAEFRGDSWPYHGTWHLREHDFGDPLPTIEDWPPPLPIKPTVGNPTLFPGDTSALPGFGVVPMEAYQHLRSRNSEFDAKMSSGSCIVGVRFFHVYVNGSGLLPNTVRPEVLIFFETTDDGHTTQRWMVTWGKDLLGNQAYDDSVSTEPSNHSTSSIPGGCPAVHESPMAATSAVDFLQQAANLPVTSPAPPDFLFSISNGSIFRRPPTDGWAYYALVYYPPGSDPYSSGTFFPNSLSWDANRESWEYVMVPSQDVKAFEGSAPVMVK
jgi:hypothetical protein